MDMKTRAALGMIAAGDLAYLASLHRSMDREWLANLLEYAIAVGQAETQRRVESIFGPFVAEMLEVPNDPLEMDDYMVI